MPPITGSMNVVKLLTEGLNDVVGATFAVEPDPEKAAVFLRRLIEAKRKIQDTAPPGKLSDTLSIIGGAISPDFEDQSHLCSGIFYLGIVQMLK